MKKTSEKPKKAKREKTPRTKKTKKQKLGIAFLILVLIGVVCAVLALIVNASVKKYGKTRIVTPEEASEIGDFDCILVLGCGVHDDGSPTDMLSDRIRRGVELYSSGASPKILMSGDHGRKDYDEVNTMKNIAIADGVPSEDVFMDHAGFSTYESVYRAKEIFGAKKILVVSQKYHLYRALRIAKALGVEAYGVGSDYHTYVGQSVRECREIAARCKDFLYCVFKPEPTYLGDQIDIHGSGDATNDR